MTSVQEPAAGSDRVMHRFAPGTRVRTVCRCGQTQEIRHPAGDLLDAGEVVTVLSQDGWGAGPQNPIYEVQDENGDCWLVNEDDLVAIDEDAAPPTPPTPPV